MAAHLAPRLNILISIYSINTINASRTVFPWFPARSQCMRHSVKRHIRCQWYISPSNNVSIVTSVILVFIDISIPFLLDSSLIYQRPVPSNHPKLYPSLSKMKLSAFLIASLALIQTTTAVPNPMENGLLVFNPSSVATAQEVELLEQFSDTPVIQKRAESYTAIKRLASFLTAPLSIIFVWALRSVKPLKCFIAGKQGPQLATGQDNGN